MKQLEDIREGKRRPNNHTGNQQSYEWRSQDCFDYVNNLYPRSHINFSELAREFGVNDIDVYQSDNKNQVVKKFHTNFDENHRNYVESIAGKQMVDYITTLLYNYPRQSITFPQVTV